MSTTTPTRHGESRETALGLGLEGLVFGCDYNPEQWSRQIWEEDVALMQQAGVNLVAINIFGWSQVEPARGEFDFTDLDAIIGLLHAAGIGINLGTGTSSPPPWLSTEHPEILPVMADGTRRWPGGRQAWCPSSPVFRESALELVRATAERYGAHPAVRLWHVSNELGCHNAHCYCDVSAAAFRRWLESRYGTIEALNASWGTSFWSQRYTAWNQILPPRATLSASNPTQIIDFDRFSSDELLDYYRAEEAVIRRVSDIQVTTNFMVAAHIKTQDYWRWAPEMDVVANDHYLDHRLARPYVELSFAGDVTRGLAEGRPWLLMEHSTSAVNWQPRNLAKAPGEMLRNTVAHIARGADGVCFFQWRASVKGAEKFHSALVPHAGVRSQLWSDVVELGALVSRLGVVQGSTVTSRVAIVFSWESWWAADLEGHPSGDVSYIDQVHGAYDALWDLGIGVDVVAPGAALDSYQFVVVPALYLVSDAAAAVVDDYVAAGGHVLVTFFSGIVDDTDGVRDGGYPGAFRQTLGIRVEEFAPLAPGETVALSDGSESSLWSEPVDLEGATAVLSYASGRFVGRPAVTRNDFGRGVAWYVSTLLAPSALRDLVATATRGAHVVASTTAPQPGVEIVRRQNGSTTWTFVFNHSDVAIDHEFKGFELVDELELTGKSTLPPGGTHIIQQDRTAS